MPVVPVPPAPTSDPFLTHKCGKEQLLGSWPLWHKPRVLPSTLTHFAHRSSIKSGIGELLACQSVFILYLRHCWGHFTSVKASDYRHKQGGKEKVGGCRHSQFPSPCITVQAGCPRMSVLGCPLLVMLATGVLPTTMGAAVAHRQNFPPPLMLCHLWSQ